MKQINLKCESCGAELELDLEKKIGFCPYCGTKLLIDEPDTAIYRTERIIDEARIKEAEVRLKELEFAREKELREEEIRKQQQKTYTILLAVLIVIAFVTYKHFRQYLPLIVVIGVIVYSSVRSSDKKAEQGGSGPASGAGDPVRSEGDAHTEKRTRTQAADKTGYNTAAQENRRPYEHRLYSSGKSRLVALLLCLLLGVIGAHRFYAGKVGTGILYIFTGGLFGIGYLVDLIRIICGTFKDSEGRYITSWES